MKLKNILLIAAIIAVMIFFWGVSLVFEKWKVEFLLGFLWK